MSLHQGTIEANGLTFAYLDTGGDGPLALCLHGFPDSAWSWERLLPELAAAGYRGVAPFLRGYAPTSIPADGCYQPGALASDANALHEAFGADGDAVLIGHDWGALASYPAAGAAPDRWRRVVTAAVPPPAIAGAGMLSPDQLRRSWYIWFFQTPLAEMVVGLDVRAFVQRLWDEWSPGFADNADPVDRTVACLEDPANLAAAIGYYRAVFGSGARNPDYDAVEAAGATGPAAPTLYLHGADDGCMGAELVDESAVLAVLPAGSRVEVVPGTGHFLHLEDPATVNRAILDFLAT